MKKSLLCFAIAAIALLAACKKKDSATPSTTPAKNNSPSTNYLVPLKTGNVWNFRSVLYYDEYPPTPYDTEYYALQVTSVDNINGTAWYVTISDGDTIYVSNKSVGQIDSISNYASELEYEYPASVNASYVFDPYGDSATVISINMPVTVPNGTFSCYEYRLSELGIVDLYDYVSPGMGPAKEDVYDAYDGYLVEETVLITHTLN